MEEKKLFTSCTLRFSRNYGTIAPEMNPTGSFSNFSSAEGTSLASNEGSNDFDR
jgi:hypothetical protein